MAADFKSCEDPANALLIWYLNGSLEGDEQEAVRLHLMTCAICQGEMDELSLIGRRIRENPELLRGGALPRVPSHRGPAGDSVPPEDPAAAGGPLPAIAPTASSSLPAVEPMASRSPGSAGAPMASSSSGSPRASGSPMSTVAPRAPNSPVPATTPAAPGDARTARPRPVLRAGSMRWGLAAAVATALVMALCWYSGRKSPELAPHAPADSIATLDLGEGASRGREPAPRLLAGNAMEVRISFLPPVNPAATYEMEVHGPRGDVVVHKERAALTIDARGRSELVAAADSLRDAGTYDFVLKEYEAPDSVHEYHYPFEVGAPDRP